MNDLYRKINWPDYEKIQEKLVPLVLDFLQHDERKKFFNKFTDKERETLEKQVPELFETFKKTIKGDVEQLRFIYIGEDFPKENIAHIDFTEKDFDNGSLPDFFYRLNWPILNAESHETIYYRSDKPAQWRENAEKNCRGFSWNESELVKLDSFVIDRPTLMDVQTIHGVYPLYYKFPRILLSFRPSNGDSQYLRDLVSGKYNLG